MGAHVGQTRYREAVAAFIARFRDERPWYFLIQAKVTNEDDEGQTFIKTLGVSDKAGMALLKAAGLVSIRVVKGQAVLIIEHEQW
jgi:hypothetical protein